jgi:hypothetical protein
MASALTPEQRNEYCQTMFWLINYGYAHTSYDPKLYDAGKKVAALIIPASTDLSDMVDKVFRDFADITGQGLLSEQRVLIGDFLYASMHVRGRNMSGSESHRGLYDLQNNLDALWSISSKMHLSQWWKFFTSEKAQQNYRQEFNNRLRLIAGIAFYEAAVAQGLLTKECIHEGDSPQMYVARTSHPLS